MSRRDDLLAALGTIGREHSNAEVMFHNTVSERIGISAVEEKTLDLLERDGPLTAGELASRTGLAPASVTGLIDRLVRKGFVRRVAHTEDRRRVNVEINRARVDGLAELFSDIAARFGTLYDGYSDEELELILDYVRKATAILREAAVTVGGLPPESEGGSAR